MAESKNTRTRTTISRNTTVVRPSAAKTPSRRPTVSRPTTTAAKSSSNIVKTEPKITTKIVKVSKNFTIYANKDTESKVVSVKKGDGEMHSTSPRRVKITAVPTLSYDANTGNVKAVVKITMETWEKDYEKSAPKDYLKFSKQIQQSLSVGKAKQEEGKGAKNKDGKYEIYKYTEITAVPFSLDRNTYSTAIYQSNYPAEQTGFKNLSPNDYPSENQHQNWMAMEDIRVQVNASGSELYGTNNLAVTGVVNFYFKVTTKTWTEYRVESVTGKQKVTTTPGSYKVVESSVLDPIREVLGFGYDITGSYCDTASVKHPVVSIEKINELKRLKITQQKPFIKRSSIEGESLEEYSKNIESSLNVKVAASCFGVSFSNDTSHSSSESRSMSENRKFVKIKSLFKNKEYQMFIDYKNNLNPEFLDPTFLNDLQTSDAETIVENYGTHVLLGAVYGASASYNMSYIKSVNSITTASTFSNTTVIGYNPTGGTKDRENKENSKDKKSAIAKLVEELGGVENLSDEKFKALMGAYEAEVEAQNKASKETKSSDSKDSKDAKDSKDSKDSKNSKDTKDSKDSKGSKDAISLNVSYTESETESNSFENSTTEVVGLVYGGDWKLGTEIRDGKLEKFSEWEAALEATSTSLENHTWCDFIPGTIIPIYEFIPLGYKVTAEEVRNVWTRYMESKGKILTPTEQKMLRCNINISGDSNSVKNIGKLLGHEDNDAEVTTKQDKTTGWKVRFELVNLDNGNVAVVVQLTVGEWGLDANRTKLMLHYPIEVANNEGGLTVIDTIKCNSFYETSGEIYREEHGLIDVTRYFYDCPFLNLENDTTNKVYIGLDGKGNDEKHLRIKVDNFYLPVLVNKED